MRGAGRYPSTFLHLIFKDERGLIKISSSVLVKVSSVRLEKIYSFHKLNWLVSNTILSVLSSQYTDQIWIHWTQFLIVCAPVVRRRRIRLLMISEFRSDDNHELGLFVRAHHYSCPISSTWIRCDDSLAITMCCELSMMQNSEIKTLIQSKATSFFQDKDWWEWIDGPTTFSNPYCSD